MSISPFSGPCGRSFYGPLGRLCIVYDLARTMSVGLCSTSLIDHPQALPFGRMW